MKRDTVSLPSSSSPSCTDQKAVREHLLWKIKQCTKQLISIHAKRSSITTSSTSIRSGLRACVAQGLGKCRLECCERR